MFQRPLLRSECSASGRGRLGGIVTTARGICVVGWQDQRVLIMDERLRIVLGLSGVVG